MDKRPVLLVVDDDPAIHLLFQRMYSDRDVRLVEARTGKEGLQRVADAGPDVLVLDVKLPDISGVEVFREVSKSAPKLPVIFITTSGASETAIEAMRLGAFDYLMKPLDLEQVDSLIERAFETHRLMNVPVAVPETGVGDEGADVLIGRSPAMQAVYKAIGRSAPQDVTVLIRGDSGSGKELVARAIYQHSKRASRPFLAINCAAIPEQLLESELFGHEAGAFTGADRRRIGKFEQLDGGTLFLDEIGDMPLVLQSKLLRVLQEGEFERIGGNATIRADVRIIAATHQDLEELMADGRFRPDLFYRFNVFTIRLLPLRERREDLDSLVSHFLRRFGQEYEKPSIELGEGVMGLLERYDWPGNIRELQSVCKQAIIQSDGRLILPEDLPRSVRADEAEPSEACSVPSGVRWGLEEFVERRLRDGAGNLHAESTARLEELLLRRVLEFAGGNQSRAAQILGITRGSVRNKIRQFGIDLDAFLPESEKAPPADPEDGDAPEEQ